MIPPLLEEFEQLKYFLNNYMLAEVTDAKYKNILIVIKNFGKYEYLLIFEDISSC